LEKVMFHSRKPEFMLRTIIKFGHFYFSRLKSH